jgi:hypothetical protein
MSEVLLLVILLGTALTAVSATESRLRVPSAFRSTSKEVRDELWAGCEDLPCRHGTSGGSRLQASSWAWARFQHADGPGHSPGDASERMTTFYSDVQLRIWSGRTPRFQVPHSTTAAGCDNLSVGF